MLVISRKKSETLVIGGNIEVTVLEVQGDRVKLGVSAPSDVKVVRSELLETESLNKIASETPTAVDFSRLRNMFGKQ